MSNQVVQQIDLGLRVLGVDQCEYAVSGVRGKTLGQAVGLASIYRATELECAMDGYAAVIRLREKKLQELSDILAVLAATHAQWDANPEKKGYNDVCFSVAYHDYFNSQADFVKALDKYGITHGEWKTPQGSGDKISAASMDRIQSDANYKAQMADTDLQGDMTTLQNYFSKRDSAFSTASKMQRKCDNSISAQMKYMGG